MAFREENFIRKIHAERQKNVPTPSSGASVDPDIRGNDSELEDALTLLSRRIDNESAHVLLELIKNADEAGYGENVKPKLVITYDSHFLCCSSNQLGFSTQDVTALCSVKRSTKGHVSHLGGKQLGFKSVFKIGDVVWIRSEGYEFKLDRRSFLGMIDPIPESFPKEQKDDAYSTQILVKVRDSIPNKGYIEDQLRHLDETLLLFLKHLKCIEIHITTLESIPSFANTITTFKRQDQKYKEAEVATLTAHRGSLGELPNNYIVVSHTIQDMPGEQQRAGVDSVELVLAFPLERQSENSSKKKKVYAYVPIQTGALRFLVHADFILTNDSTTIERSCAWNEKIRTELVAAFLEGVQEFNKSKIFDHWLQFLVDPGDTTDELFCEFYSSAIEEIKNHEVLRSTTEKLCKPISMVYLPSKYRDHQRFPLIPCDRNWQYLHPQYTHDQVKPLGVVSMELGQFQDFLCSYVLHNETEFKNKPAEWHECLANLLHDNFSNLSSTTKGLPLLRLRDGTLVPLESDNTYFGTTTDGIRVPGGLGINLIDEGAGNGSYRAKLYLELTRGKLTVENVVDMILSCQNSQAHLGTCTTSNDHLLEQAKFLFMNASLTERGNEIQTLWVSCTRLHDESGKIITKQKHEVFFPDNNFKGFKTYFTKSDYDIYQLDPSWLEVYQDTEYHSKWIRWLEEEVEMFSTLRLTITEDSLQFSPKLEMLLEKDPNRLALLLRDRWQDYSSDIARLRSQNRQLYERLCEMKLDCLDGGRQALNCCYIARPSLTKDAIPGSNVSFARLDDPNHWGWALLTELGLKTEPDAAFYIQCLLRHKETRSTSKWEILSLYTKIQESSSYSLHTLRDEFCNNKLVAYPLLGDAPLRWYSPKEVVWEGSRFLTHTPILSNDVPSLAALFRDRLQIPMASLQTFIREGHIITEIKPFLTQEGLDPILLEIERNLRGSDISKAIEQMKHLKLFHVDLPQKGPLSMRSYQFLTQQNLCLSDEWFVVDNETMRDTFKGYVPTWCIPVGRLNLYRSFMSLLFRDRVLSHVCKTNDPSILSGKKHKELTTLIQQKAYFILRLVQGDSFSQALETLTSLQVYACEKILISRYVSCRSQKINGRECLSDLHMMYDRNSEKKTCSIYVSEQDARDPMRIAWWLVADFLSDTLAIKDEMSRDLMRRIMTCSVHQKLQDLLYDKGIFLLTEEETAEVKAAILENESEPSRSGSVDIPSVHIEEQSSSGSEDDLDQTNSDSERTPMNEYQRKFRQAYEKLSITPSSSEEQQLGIEPIFRFTEERRSPAGPSLFTSGPSVDENRASIPQSSKSQAGLPSSHRHNNFGFGFSFSSPSNSAPFSLFPSPLNGGPSTSTSMDSGKLRTEKPRSNSFSSPADAAPLSPGEPFNRPSSASGPSLFNPSSSTGSKTTTAGSMIGQRITPNVQYPTLASLEPFARNLNTRPNRRSMRSPEGKCYVVSLPAPEGKPF